MYTAVNISPKELLGLMDIKKALKAQKKTNKKIFMYLAFIGILSLENRKKLKILNNKIKTLEGEKICND